MRTVGAFILAFISALIDAWLVMLCVGAAHASDHRIPALGFNTIAWLFVALFLVCGSAAHAARQ